MEGCGVIMVKVSEVKLIIRAKPTQAKDAVSLDTLLALIRNYQEANPPGIQGPMRISSILFLEGKTLEPGWEISIGGTPSLTTTVTVLSSSLISLGKFLVKSLGSGWIHVVTLDDAATFI